ncbi:Uncharacterised protein [Mycobacteroides abscessus subsp. abscessus]|nr:Uncharacterised protein [Mycobacteroides abscessus subsp. abscessus]
MASSSWPVCQLVASMISHPKSIGPSGNTIWRGFPPGASKRVRRLSWRPIKSDSAAPRAAASSRP